MASVLDERFLAITAIVTVLYQLAFFVVSYACKFDKVTDFAGGTNFLVLALLTFFLSATYYPRQIVVTALVVAWAIRLAGFLLYRILLWGQDRRFDDMRESLPRLAFFWLLQAVWVWTVSLPVTVLNASDRNPSLGAADYIAWTLIVTGLLLETVADFQKLFFKQSPKSRGMWTYVGTWSWSRHPNYFGEVLVWIGAFLGSVRVLRGSEWAVIIGPVFIVCLLMFVSGIPLNEASADKKHGDKEEYRQYKRRTSVLIPIPPSLYEKVPQSVKSSLLLDFPLYNNLHGRPNESTPIAQRES